MDQRKDPIEHQKTALITTHAAGLRRLAAYLPRGKRYGRERNVDRPAEPTSTTMFYDGGCPLCSREVAHYRRLDQKGRVHWVDIHANPRAVDSLGVEYEEAMARLHVRDEAGEIQTGVFAFAAVWDALPYYRWLARVLRTLRLLPALDLAYTRFARWRFRRRGCETGTCTSP